MPDCRGCPHNDPAKQKAAGVTPRATCCTDAMDGHRRMMEHIAAGHIGAARPQGEKHENAKVSVRRKPYR